MYNLDIDKNDIINYIQNKDNVTIGLIHIHNGDIYNIGVDGFSLKNLGNGEVLVTRHIFADYIPINEIGNVDMWFGSESIRNRYKLFDILSNVSVDLHIQAEILRTKMIHNDIIYNYLDKNLNNMHRISDRMIAFISLLQNSIGFNVLNPNIIDKIRNLKGFIEDNGEINYPLLEEIISTLFNELLLKINQYR